MPSAATLKRIWANAGVGLPPGRRARGVSAVAEAPAVEKAAARPPSTEDDTVVLYGGAGLAFLSAADAEFGAAAALASAILQEAESSVDESVPGQGALDDSKGLDKKGHFSAAYNARWREGVAPGKADARWADDERKALARNLKNLKVLKLSAPTVARHMLAIGASPLLTNRRGLDGLDGPNGAWTETLGGAAYMPKTLTFAVKCLKIGNVTPSAGFLRTCAINLGSMAAALTCRLNCKIAVLNRADSAESRTISPQFAQNPPATAATTMDSLL